MVHDRFPSRTFPQTSAEFLAKGRQYEREINALKRSADVAWYPFDSLTALPLLSKLLEPRFAEICQAVRGNPVLDLGCADGDVACLFSKLGAEVDAVDCATTNYNKMKGVRRLCECAGVPAQNIHDVDLDERFGLPRTRYGLTLFLGTLYHLKSPYHVLEKLAFATEWCVLSTRIAQYTPRVGAMIDEEPVAYLADGREINNDPTNYWIFSAFGLLRILQRTRWAIWETKRVGCLSHSDPINNESDERMFVLLQSRVYSPALQVRRLLGWYDADNVTWCWTAKQFNVQVVLPLEKQLSGFKFEFYVPEAIWSNRNDLALNATISGQPCGSISCSSPGFQELTGSLPPFSLHEPKLIISFEVTSEYVGKEDPRSLGVCVTLMPLLEKVEIPLSVF